MIYQAVVAICRSFKSSQRLGGQLKKFCRGADILKNRDTVLTEGTNKMSGTVYIADNIHFEMCSEIYAKFAHSNPLHSEIFPSVCRMEAEIVSMTAAIMSGNFSKNDNVCGTITSGGTESILTAIRTARDYMQERRKIFHPEMYKLSTFFYLILSFITE